MVKNNQISIPSNRKRPSPVSYLLVLFPVIGILPDIRLEDLCGRAVGPRGLRPDPVPVSEHLGQTLDAEVISGTVPVHPVIRVRAHGEAARQDQGVLRDFWDVRPKQGLLNLLGNWYSVK